MYGAGCWAQHEGGKNLALTERSSVACSVSGTSLEVLRQRDIESVPGTGEYIARTCLARLVGERVLEGILFNPKFASIEEGAATPKAASRTNSGEDEDEADDDDDEVVQYNDTHQILQTILGHEFWGTLANFMQSVY